jgi:hypothetical protein
MAKSKTDETVETVKPEPRTAAGFIEQVLPYYLNHYVGTQT